MRQANADLRLLARGNNVPLWAIAERLSVSEQTLLRHWRKELPEREKERVQVIIKALQGGCGR